MDEHLASCPTCYEVFAETLRFALDEEAEAAFPRSSLVAIPLVRRPAFRLAAILAVAASVFLAFQQLWRARSERAAPPLIAELAQAMGTKRFVEPRLTGGFQHGRLIVLRSGDASQGLDGQSPAVLAAVARIRERTEGDTSPEGLGALAVTYLVSGDIAKAVKALESATAQAPKNPRLQSDLAAAYLVRASRLDEPADLPKALEAAEKAIELKDAPDEAWFNRALALESLHLVDSAKKAWEDFLKRDSTSGWADEARKHLEELPPAQQSTIEEDRARARAALAEGPTAVDRLADESPSILHEYFENELLPAWADAQLTGHPNGVVLRAHAELLGEALLRTTTDALPRDAARALVSAPSGPSRDPPHTQALGYKTLHEAQRLYDLQQPSCDTFREARRLLESGGSPYAPWARERAVSSCFYPAQPEAATVELGEVEVIAEQHRYVRLLGRVQWMQGLISGSNGDLTASLKRYRLARDSFVESRDPESEAVALALVAQNQLMLGESRRAWIDRTRSLALLDQVESPRRRHAIVDEAVHACLAERLPRSGLHLAAVLVASAERGSRAVVAIEAFLRRAILSHALGDERNAAADLEQARRWIPRISDQRHLPRVAAQVEATRGELLASTQPDAAAQAVRLSLAHFRVTMPQRVPSLELVLGRALRRQGLDEDAERELLAGIQELERQQISLHDVALQVSSFDLGLPLFDDMVRLQADRGQPERALSFVERARCHQLADSLRDARASAHERAAQAIASNLPLEPRALRDRLRRDVALLYYAALEDRLLAWILTRGGSECIARDLPAARLQQLVAAHRATLEQPSSVEAARQIAATLFDELVRPLLPAIGSRRVLVVVPDAVLQTVSFASLVDRQTGRYLVEDHAIDMAPSGTVFARSSAAASARQESGHALIVGNPSLEPRLRATFPNLPGAQSEAIEIARLYRSSELLTGSQATKAAFLKGIHESQIVHFAGHAASSNDLGLASRILLAPDGGEGGSLYPGELASRSFPQTRLVVLAACRTAAGAIASVEGALSLGRPFLAAGVPSVVASLSDVDDEISQRFFVAFHSALLRGAEPLLALRDTQLAMLRGGNPTLSHPAAWAGFVCMGGLDHRKLADTSL